MEVPAHDQDFYALKNVPHGQLRQTLFYSKSADAVLQCFVYTPPDYDKDAGKSIIPCCICNMAVAKMKRVGGSKATPVGSWTTCLPTAKLPFIIVMANSYVPAPICPVADASVATTNAGFASAGTNSGPLPQAGVVRADAGSISARSPRCWTEELIPH